MKKNQFFNQTAFLDAIQDRVENTIKPLSGRVGELEKGQKTIVRTLAKHTETLDTHTKILAKHTETLDTHTKQLGFLEKGQKEIRTDLNNHLSDDHKEINEKLDKLLEQTRRGKQRS